MENTITENLLRELLEEVQLLTVQAKVDALQKFKNDFLTSDLRRNMYDAFDGERTLPEISDDIGCKINTLQIFAQQLVDKNLVDYTFKGNARIIKKSLSKIALYYANKELGES
ncbi:hypothetical protein [Ruthenibacterium lactatiformans]|uniref:hypothetical protein n=1 Tax=Ruthenibacterium lactatiformans TaxID=1550024 RepID=UPI00210C9D58|nr:hypothetical protein [Ruthenibacterium lactatiformans]MCQ5087513.1 hypothetical protein [Ruthenibacterium lactatiformans]